MIEWSSDNTTNWQREISFNKIPKALLEISDTNILLTFQSLTQDTISGTFTLFIYIYVCMCVCVQVEYPSTFGCPYWRRCEPIQRKARMKTDMIQRTESTRSVRERRCTRNSTKFRARDETAAAVATDIPIECATDAAISSWWEWWVTASVNIVIVCVSKDCHHTPKCVVRRKPIVQLAKDEGAVDALDLFDIASAPIAPSARRWGIWLATHI